MLVECEIDFCRLSLDTFEFGCMHIYVVYHIFGSSIVTWSNFVINVEIVVDVLFSVP